MSAYSSGKFISIDLTTKTATLLKKYISPERLLSPSQGDVRTLSSGDQFISWRNLALPSEFMPNRTYVLHAQFGAVTDDAHTTTCSYSAHRGNWTGVPGDDPAIFTEWD